ncbi:hypothetical protein BDV18DRAFT_161391 [Aspergillus unguis]
MVLVRRNRGTQEPTAGLWNKTLDKKIRSLSKDDAALLRQLLQSDNKDSSLLRLTESYEAKGFIRYLRRLEPLLETVDAFTNAITSICQGFETATVVWGCLQLLLTVSLRFTGVLSTIHDMLDEISDCIPKFNTYVGLFPTAALAQAIVPVYENVVDFCVTTVRFLNRPPIASFLSFYKSPIDKKFTQVRENLFRHRARFEASAKLEGEKAAAARHTEVQQTLQGISDAVVANHSQRAEWKAITSTIRMVPLARNPLFSGRAEELRLLDEHLADENGPHRMRSCLVHGMGGVGKTQLALEYLYRNSGRYSHAFWVRGSTEHDLSQSFIEIAAKAAPGQETEGLSAQRQIGIARRWLIENDIDWLLVFDNVNNHQHLLPYWPPCNHGTIIVTSQNPTLVNLTGVEVKIQPLSAEDGCSLVLKQLRHTAGGEDLASKVSAQLGGHPLAISQFIGYCRTASLSLSETLPLLESKGVYEIFSSLGSANASFGEYDKTLDTVWDLALELRSPQARELLSTIAFFHPDAIEESMLLAEHEFLPLIYIDQPKDINLKLIIADLRQRHLIERVGEGSDAHLRMHRLLKRSLIAKLDRQPEQLKDTFAKATAMVRSVYPPRDLKTPLQDSSHSYQKYTPHVLEMLDLFNARKEALSGDLALADLFCDAAYYLWENHLPGDIEGMLVTADDITLRILGRDTWSPLLADITAYRMALQVGNATGAQGRRKALELSERTVRMRQLHLQGLSPGASVYDAKFHLARAYRDNAMMHLEAEALDEAAQRIDAALALFYEIGNEDTLSFRIGRALANKAMMRVCQGHVSEGLDMYAHAAGLVSEGVPDNHPRVLEILFDWAMLLTTTGRFEEALEKYEKTRVERVRTKNYAATISYYHVGLLHHLMGNLAEAERLLREGLQYSTEINGGVAITARTHYRLSLVLHELRRDEEAKYEEDIALATLPETLRVEVLDEPDRMKGYDMLVPTWHGRVTGIFSPHAMKR